MVKVSPLFLVRFNKKMLGLLGRQMSKRHRGIVEKNLGIAFPDYTENEKSKLKDAIYNHFSSILVDIICLFVKKNPGKILKEPQPAIEHQTG
jgi:lauroyl/myristoyl acyltransferase